ncbi:MAG: FAD-binding oxidoreductase [Deltaproteobacteria bacterium]|nr:FAD-binding oxidoreductase [Deltaproteobacteria bacterium]
MKKGIWEEFDGYQGIIEEIEAAKKYREQIIPGRYVTKEYVDRLHPARLTLKVSDLIEETPSTKTLRLTSSNGALPPFLAGQYIALYPVVGPIKTGRPYSISSPPSQTGHYDITVRRVEDGLVSNYLLDEIKTGDTIEASGPSGQFYFNPLVHDKTMVCIAGGSGITPFMSMIRDITDRGLDREVFLFYGNRTTKDIIFNDELAHIASRFGNIHFIPVIEKPAKSYKGKCGFITGATVKEVIGNTKNKTFFMCGPQGLYDFCLPELETLSIPGRKIRRELYGPPTQIWKYPGWPKKIKAETAFTVSVKGGESFTAKAGESLLASIEKEGIAVPSLCRSGECSMCRVKVLKGKVFQPAGTLVRKSDRWFGYVHSCVSFPIEDLEILI